MNKSDLDDYFVFSGSYPKTVYRFRPCETDYFWTELDQAIMHQKVRLNSKKDLNDPYEMRPRYVESGIREVKEYLAEFEKRFGKNLDATGVDRKLFAKEHDLDWRKLRKFFGPTNDAARLAILNSRKLLKLYSEESNIACFSEQWENLLMWAHYTNGHNGICLEFDVDQSVMFNSRIGLEKVWYSDERPQISTAEFLRYQGMGLAPDAPDFFDRDSLYGMTTKICRTKSNHWSYEKEWRLESSPNENAGYFHIPALKVTSILVGEKVSVLMRKRIRERFREYCKVEEIVTHADEFQFKRVGGE